MEVSVRARKRNGRKWRSSKSFFQVFMEGLTNVRTVADMDVTTEVQKRIKSLTGFKNLDFLDVNQYPAWTEEKLHYLNMAIWYHRKLTEQGKIFCHFMTQVQLKNFKCRCMMYIGGPQEVYFIDRDNIVWHSSSFMSEGFSHVLFKFSNLSRCSRLKDFPFFHHKASLNTC